MTKLKVSNFNLDGRLVAIVRDITNEQYEEIRSWLRNINHCHVFALKESNYIHISFDREQELNWFILKYG